MLHQSKYDLFNDNYMLKIENPEMTIDEWMSFIDDKKCSFRVEKVVSGKKALGGKKFGYKISTQDPLWHDIPAPVRKKGDFHLLYLQLEKRFPNAVVPKISKNEVDNLHLMELYLTELSLNPFFRMDVSFSDFLTAKCQDYKQTKKHDRKHSQGTLRWLQMNTKYMEVETPIEYIRSLKSEFDLLERAQKSIIKAIEIEIRALNQLQVATSTFTQGLGDFLAMEQASEANNVGSTAGLPNGRLRQRVQELIGLNQDHLKGLRQAYDPGSLERLTVHPILIELKMIAGLKKVLALLDQSKADFDREDAAYNAMPNEDVGREKKKEVLANKEAVYFKNRRAMGFELERFRTYRTLKFQTFLNAIVRFNLRGSQRIMEEWSKSGLKLDPREEAEFYKMDQIYNDQNENPVSGGRGRAASMAPRGPDIQEFVSLEVTNSYSSMMSSKYLKVTKGELLTGYQLDHGDWQVTNASGQKGLVKGANVKVVQLTSKPGQSNSFNGNNSFNNYIPNDMAGDDEDWSMSDDGGQRVRGNGSFNNRSQPPQAPVAPRAPEKPALPPGLVLANPGSPGGFGLPPMPGIGGASSSSEREESPKGFQLPMPPSMRNNNAAPTPPTAAGGFNAGPKPPTGGFNAAPTPPVGGFNPAPTPPVGGFGDSGPSTGGFGMPGPAPVGVGGFGQPGPAPGPIAGFGMPGPKDNLPAFGGGPMGGGPKPPMQAPKPSPTPKPAAEKSTKNAGGAPKLGGGMPKGPGGGGLSFLADIKKGNAVKLNKVPDEDKSKEIGGDKGRGPPGAVVGPGGPTGNVQAPAPVAPMGGGGGMLGELAARLNRRG